MRGVSLCHAGGHRAFEHSLRHAGPPAAIFPRKVLTVSQIKPGHDVGRRFGVRISVRPFVRSLVRPLVRPFPYSLPTRLVSLAALACGLCAPGLAQADYRVRVDAPKDIAKLLKDNLDVVRFASPMSSRTSWPPLVSRCRS